MGRKLDALNAIAVEQGHTGDEPTSVVGAINAIVDAMGGTGNAASIADAITALAPYIGGGGGGIGKLAPVPLSWTNGITPEIGDSMLGGQGGTRWQSMPLNVTMNGNEIVTNMMPNSWYSTDEVNPACIPVGSTAFFPYAALSDGQTVVAWIATLGESTYFTAVRDYDSITADENGTAVTIPDIGTNEVILFSVRQSDGE